MSSNLNSSLEDLLNYVCESLGSQTGAKDDQVDDNVGPSNEEYDFLGFDSQIHNKNNVEVSASSTLRERPKRTLRPSRRPMDDQYDWAIE